MASLRLLRVARPCGCTFCRVHRERTISRYIDYGPDSRQLTLRETAWLMGETLDRHQGGAG